MFSNYWISDLEWIHPVHSLHQNVAALRSGQSCRFRAVVNTAENRIPVMYALYTSLINCFLTANVFADSSNNDLDISKSKISIFILIQRHNAIKLATIFLFSVQSMINKTTRYKIQCGFFCRP
jgi:hypothetical protein